MESRTSIHRRVSFREVLIKHCRPHEETATHRLQEFLESKFGFWLITTALVAATTTANAYLQNYVAERQRNIGLAKNLQLEVEFRLSQYMSAVRQMTSGQAHEMRFRPPNSAEDLKAVTKILVGVPSQHKGFAIHSVFPTEFGQRPFASLLAELSILQPERYSHYREQIARLAGGTLFEVDFRSPFAVARLVNESLIQHAQYGDFLFYTDCPASSPLC